MVGAEHYLLAQGGAMVIYGCMCGKAPPFRWDNWVFREVQVRITMCAWYTQRHFFPLCLPWWESKPSAFQPMQQQGPHGA